MKTPGIRYGHDRDGNEIHPKDGERILEEGEPLPAMYRPWINGSGWLNPCKLHTHPGANQTARVFGNYWAYAVPVNGYAAPVQKPVEPPVDDTTHLLSSETNAARLRASIAELNQTNVPEAEAVPDVVSETPAAPDPAPVITVEEIRAKKAKRKQQMRASFGLEFDD